MAAKVETRARDRSGELASAQADSAVGVDEDSLPLGATARFAEQGEAVLLATAATVDPIGRGLARRAALAGP